MAHPRLGRITDQVVRQTTDHLKRPPQAVQGTEEERRGSGRRAMARGSLPESVRKTAAATDTGTGARADNATGASAACGRQGHEALLRLA